MPNNIVPWERMEEKLAREKARKIVVAMGNNCPPEVQVCMSDGYKGTYASYNSVSINFRPLRREYMFDRDTLETLWTPKGPIIKFSKVFDPRKFPDGP